jgi:hypothetical protein
MSESQPERQYQCGRRSEVAGASFGEYCTGSGQSRGVPLEPRPWRGGIDEGAILGVKGKGSDFSSQLPGISPKWRRSRRLQERDAEGQYDGQREHYKAAT